MSVPEEGSSESYEDSSGELRHKAYTEEPGDDGVPIESLRDNDADVRISNSIFLLLLSEISEIGKLCVLILV